MRQVRKHLHEVGGMAAFSKKSIKTIHENFSPFDGSIISADEGKDITESWTDRERFVNIGNGWKGMVTDVPRWEGYPA